MTKIIFKLDIEKDLENIYKIANKKIYGNTPSINERILAIIKDKKFNDIKDDLKEYNKKIYSSPLITIFITNIAKGWKKISGEYFRKIENITGRKFPYNEVKAYITTIGTCPYNPAEKSFMISLNYNLFRALNAIGHELMHLHFHKYYFEDIKKQIGIDRTHDLKEALTILLNLEFYELWFNEDKGYPSHKELREFIKNEWNKKKDFDELLIKAINHIQINERRLNKDEKFS